MSTKNNEPSHLGKPKNPTQNNNEVVNNEQSCCIKIEYYRDNVYAYYDGDNYYLGRTQLEVFGYMLGRIVATLENGQVKGIKSKYEISVTRTIKETNNNDNVVNNKQTRYMTIEYKGGNNYEYYDDGDYHFGRTQLEVFGYMLGRIVATLENGRIKGIEAKYEITITRLIMDN